MVVPLTKLECIKTIEPTKMPTNPNQTIHLEENDMDASRVGCVICNGESRFSAGPLQEQSKIELLSCRGCGGVHPARGTKLPLAHIPLLVFVFDFILGMSYKIIFFGATLNYFEPRYHWD